MPDLPPRRESPLSADEQLRLLTEEVRDYAFITFDLAGRITSWSPGAVRIMNWTEPEVLGQVGDLIFTPEDRIKGVVEREITTAKTQGRAEDDRWHLRKDGSRFWASGVMTLLRNDQGQPVGLAKVLRDLTQRKRIEDQLRESEAKQAFLLRLGDTLRRLNSSLEIQTQASRLLGEYLGVHRVSYVEIEGEWATVRQAYVQGVAPLPERFSYAALSEQLLAAYRRGEAVIVQDVNTDTRFTDKERAAQEAVQIAACAGVILVQRGHRVGVLEVHHARPRHWTPSEVDLIRDVAERMGEAMQRAGAEAALRESEERFRLFVQNVREYALVRTDAQGMITNWNPGAERLFGYTDEEIVGKHFQQLLTASDQQAHIVEQEFAAVRQTGRHQHARFVVRKDRSTFWADWVTEAILDENARLIGTANVLRDETERKQAEELLQNSVIEKETLLKEIHHRVKNNLQVIISLLSLQADQITEAETLAMFQDTQSRVRSIARIHETLYSSADLAQVEFAQYTRVLIDDLLAFHEEPAERIQVQLLTADMVLDITQAIPLGLILNELVVNCLKHAFPAGRGGTLTVLLRYLEAEDLGPEQTLDDAAGELCVQDDGVGLRAGFDLEQADSMGMYLIRILARQLHGTLKLEAIGGTRICVRFPLTLEGSQVNL